MTELTQRAKELYIQFLGHFLNMHKAGVLKEYKSFEIPREVELEWLQEWAMEHVKQLSIRDWDAITILESISRNYQDSWIVEKVVSFASRNIMSADSLVRLIYAEKMLEIIRSHNQVITKELLFQGCKVAVQILEDVISQPLVIDPGHELKEHNLKDKRALNSRAQQGIEEVKVLINS
ncbi:hypothetical protein [Paenibacillus odorifer]|uniref:hypothetical protein n=1 Tax=Paenibacillus odorifer TaxID=189426 RepID=UPI00096EE147|nr:hypothetical protein [Paenibacillus odorifer]OMD60407.1 hypothetical protein BSK55_09025 [Paenibacillus odorifer]